MCLWGFLLTKICTFDVNSNMTAHRICITLRPFIYDLISAKAKQRGVSLSRQIEDCAEGFLIKDEADYEPDCVITKEELLRRSQEAHKAIENGTEKLYDNLNTFFKDLDEETR